MKSNTAQVKGKICHDPNKPLYPAIKVDSKFWFTWLKEPDVRSFHYESETGKFTARKEERTTSTNEYWYAYRKIAGKLRKVYLGAMEELTGDRLEQVAAEISQPGWEFYSSRKSYTTSKKQRCVTAVALEEVTAERSYPINDDPSWVTNSSEVEDLLAEVEQLKLELVEAVKDRDRNSDTVSAHEQEIKDLKRDIEETQLELQKTRSQLQKQVASEQDALRLLATCHTEAFKAADILKAALKLKAGNGGAIKVQIKEALKLIDDV